MSTTTAAPSVPALFAIRMSDPIGGSDHFVDDAVYTIAKLLGRTYTALCGAVVAPTSLLCPRGPVCEDCAVVHRQRRLRLPVTA